MNRVLALCTLVVSLLVGLNAQAKIVTADEMTCQQAVNSYFKYGRIYVVANGKDIVPIYGMKSVLDSTPLWCSKGGHAYYWVHTTDSNSCVIAEYCH